MKTTILNLYMTMQKQGKKKQLIRENENRMRKEGIKKGVLMASVIGFIFLLITGIIVYSLYNREHKLDAQSDGITEEFLYKYNNFP